MVAMVVTVAAMPQRVVRSASAVLAAVVKAVQVPSLRGIPHKV